MKEASGELSMTLVTIIAVAVIASIMAIFWDPLTDLISDKWGTITGNPDHGVDFNPTK